MGIRRTGDSAVGVLAVKGLSVAAIAVVAGCSSTPQIAAIVGGGAAGAATANPAIGFAVGVALDAAGNYAFQYFGRTWQGSEQDAMAEVAGALPAGTEAAWTIVHTLPIGNEHGQLRVIRSIDSPLAACKEIAFSVDTGTGEKSKRAWFTSDVCKQDATWKWASAEPAVARWGFLQ